MSMGQSQWQRSPLPRRMHDLEASERKVEAVPSSPCWGGCVTAWHALSHLEVEG